MNKPERKRVTLTPRKGGSTTVEPDKAAPKKAKPEVKPETKENEDVTN